MDTENMVYRSHVMNTDVDRAIRAEATRRSSPAGVIFRLYLETGLAQFELEVPLPEAVDEEACPLRAFHIYVHTDEHLRVLCYQRNFERSDLVARLLRLGMLTLEMTRKGSRGH